MAINLVKGQRISLAKEGGSLERVTVGLGWDMAQNGKAAFDIDAFAMLCGEDGKITDFKDVVYFANLSHKSGAVTHLGDNLTGEGEGDDEQITIDLPRIPAEYQKMIIGVCIYRGDVRKQHFGMINNAFVRIFDTKTKNELCRYDLSDNSKFEGRCTMIFGELYRRNGEWKFTAVGEATPDTSITPQFAGNYLRNPIN